jgi:hypothetical protein
MECGICLSWIGEPDPGPDPGKIEKCGSIQDHHDHTEHIEAHEQPDEEMKGQHIE